MARSASRFTSLTGVGGHNGPAVKRYFRDVRAGLGNPPMDDIALKLIGKAALGL